MESDYGSQSIETGLIQEKVCDDETSIRFQVGFLVGTRGDEGIQEYGYMTEGRECGEMPSGK